MSNKTQIQFHPSRADPSEACGQLAHATSLTSIFLSIPHAYYKFYCSILGYLSCKLIIFLLFLFLSWAVRWKRSWIEIKDPGFASYSGLSGFILGMVPLFQGSLGYDYALGQPQLPNIN